MTEEPRHKTSGDTISQWITLMTNELNDIGVGLHSIIYNGRYDFELDGVALIDFIRRSLYALVERGAKPRHWGKPGDPDRNIPLHYGGDSPREIVEDVSAGWLACGGA